MVDKTPKLYVAVGALLMVAGAAAISTLTNQPAPLKSSAAPEPSAVIREQHPVHVRQPSGAPRVSTGQKDFHGNPVTVSCATCHTTTTPNRELRDSAELDEFHQGLRLKHGQLSCLSCHNAENYDTLRMADGAPVEFKNVQQLCAQCHGPQARDFKNGSHGGMTGYWDLSRGPRHRNNCTDCHNPHSPEYPTMMPVFPPAPTGPKRSDEAH